MNVGTARAAAVEWVLAHPGRQNDFRGAYFSGSTVGLPDDAALPIGSDVDVVIVTSQDEPPPKLGKFMQRGALLEATYLPRRLLASAHEVLASYHLAGSFRVDTIIADPSGELRALQAEVARHFAERAWVRRRCEDARRKVEAGVRGIDLIRRGDHREAVFWIVATFARCHTILGVDAAQDMRRALAPAFEEMLADLGIASTGDLLARAAATVRFLPALWGVAETILSTNPAIKDGWC